MSIDSIAAAIHATTLSAMVRGDTPGTEWVFPILETFHVLSLGIVFGSIAMVDLRLLGLTSRDVAFTRLYREIIPWTWVAFIFAVLFGSLLATAKIQDYVKNPQFIAKYVFMALAGINMLIFHFRTFRSVALWDTRMPVPAAAKLAGALSLTFWTGVVVCGRWIGFTT
jgi:hypothetical protein